MIYQEVTKVAGPYIFDEALSRVAIETINCPELVKQLVRTTFVFGPESRLTQKKRCPLRR